MYIHTDNECVTSPFSKFQPISTIRRQVKYIINNKLLRCTSCHKLKLKNAAAHELNRLISSTKDDMIHKIKPTKGDPNTFSLLESFDHKAKIECLSSTTNYSNEDTEKLPYKPHK